VRGPFKFHVAPTSACVIYYLLFDFSSLGDFSWQVSTDRNENRGGLVKCGFTRIELGREDSPQDLFTFRIGDRVNNLENNLDIHYVNNLDIHYEGITWITWMEITWTSIIFGGITWDNLDTHRFGQTGWPIIF
jgi:hypothetical protein